MENIIKFNCPHCDIELSADLSELEVGVAVQLECPSCKQDLIVNGEGETMPFDIDTRERVLEELGITSEHPLQIGFEETMLNLVKRGSSLDTLLSVEENKTNLMCLEDDVLVEDVEYLLSLTNIKFSSNLSYLIEKFHMTGRMSEEERALVQNCYTLAYSVGARE